MRLVAANDLGADLVAAIRPSLHILPLHRIAADAVESLIENCKAVQIVLVNGEPAKVEVIRPFEDAFEVTKQILFRPFDMQKWFVIGFAAWLANLGTGSYNYNFNRQDWKDTSVIQKVDEWLSEIPHWMLFGGIAALVVLILAITIFFAWLRARGRFMFIDCIVKNRGAIAEPWREFREEGDSYFLFSLLVGITVAVIVGVAALPFMLPLFRNATFSSPDVYMICAIVAWAFVLIVLIFAWTVVSHFMIVVMYRRRCRAREGFQAAVSLISNYPGEITLYCLFWIVLAIGAGIVSCAATLATCCLALLPYIGTVILLPVLVCLRAFGLRFVRQFGPEYDVWAVLPQAPSPAPIVPPPLPS
jgi:hypothetical protein